MQGYAEAMLGPDSGYGGDAMTVTAYLGFVALRAVLDRAAKCKGATFVIVRSSNSEGCSVQDAGLADGRTVADALADEITAFNTALGHAIGLSARSWAQPWMGSRPMFSLVFRAPWFLPPVSVLRVRV